MDNPKSFPELKICESCGANFDCGAENNRCWCFLVEISPENLAQLEKRFKRCFCPPCLESFSLPTKTAATPN